MTRWDLGPIQRDLRRRARSRLLRSFPWFLVLVVAVVGGVAVAGARAGGREVRVKRVYDGDTLQVEGRERVRLIGVDTPEREEPLYDEAKRMLENAVSGGTVQLSGCKERPRDRYGRLLAFVHAQGADVGPALLEAGLARTLFVGPCGREVARRYRQREREAFRARRGLWALQKPRRVPHQDAHRHIGRLMQVTGRVLGVHEGPRALHLNFGPDHRTDFTAVIFRRDLRRLLEEGILPVREYRGRAVEVTGYLKTYNGPEIIVESADQLRPLGSGAPAP